MNKKKIMIFMYSLGGGGVQRFIINLLSKLDSGKFDICIALVNKKGIYLNDLPSYIKVIDLNAKKIHFSLTPLIKEIRKEKPDILFSIDTTINIVAILAKLICNKNFKLVIRQAVEINEKSTGKFKILLAKKLYPLTDKCIVLTNVMKENIINKINIPEYKVQVVYNSVDLNLISRKKVEEINDNFSSIKGPKLIAVGRLTRQKNQLLLLDSFELVLKRNDANLILVGDGEDRGKIEAKIKEKKLEKKVMFLGYQDNPYKYIYNSDIFILPSLYEGLSNALLEALACDIPIITTDNPDNIIEDRVNGFYARLNKEDLAEKIDHLIFDSDLRKDIIMNNREYVKTFDLVEMKKKYENIFSEM